jgi:hypothetical protein
MERARRTILLSGLVLAGAVLVTMTACSHDSSTPTEPKHTPVQMSVKLTSGAEGQAGTVTVRTSVCGCCPSGVKVSIDGAEIGSVGCAASGEFPISAGRHTLKLSAPEVELPMSLEFPADGPGFLVDVSCAAR